MKFFNPKYSASTDQRSYILARIFYMILGLIPWCSITPLKSKPKWYRRIYLIIILSGMLILALTSLLKEMFNFYFPRRFTIITFDTVYTSTMVFINFYTILSVHFWKYETYNDMLSGFIELDRIIDKYIIKNKRINWRSCLKILNFKLFIPLSTFAIHVYIAGSYLFVQAFEALQVYHMLFTVISVQYYMQQITYKYEALGDIISNNIRLEILEKFPKKEIEICLDDMLQCLITLNEQVRRVNKVYGFFILLLMVHSITSSLFYFEMALFFYIFNLINFMFILLTWCFLTLVRSLKVYFSI